MPSAGDNATKPNGRAARETRTKKNKLQRWKHAKRWEAEKSKKKTSKRPDQRAMYAMDAELAKQEHRTPPRGTGGTNQTARQNNLQRRMQAERWKPNLCSMNNNHNAGSRKHTMPPCRTKSNPAEIFTGTARKMTTNKAHQQQNAANGCTPNAVGTIRRKGKCG